MSLDRPYVESPIIMATVRLVAPFVLTYGLFVTLHGASSPGGGFQGGVIAASVIVMLSFAYGIDPTWEWLDKRVLVGLTSGGIAVFAGIALGPILVPNESADFLELGVYPVPHASKYGIELVEVGIAMTVAGVVTLLFFALARGAMPPGGSPYASPSSGSAPSSRAAPSVDETGQAGSTDAPAPAGGSATGRTDRTTARVTDDPTPKPTDDPAAKPTDDETADRADESATGGDRP